MQQTKRFGRIVFTAIVLSSAIPKPVAADARSINAYLGMVERRIMVLWNALGKEEGLK